MIQAKITTCPYCDSRSLIKKGLRKNQIRELQVFLCTNCFKYFTPLNGLKTKFSPELIGKALLLYYQGNTQDEVATHLRQKNRIKIPRRTISRWILKYKPICTFFSLRQKALSLYAKENFIEEFALEHRQVYLFKKHLPKLNLLVSTIGQVEGPQLLKYLNTISSPTFPHNLFRDQPVEEKKNQEGENNTLLRSSQLLFETLPFVISHKQDGVNDLATFGLFLAKRTIERHPMIEEFMLACDAATVAIEVPVYLQQEEVQYFRNKGFYLPIDDLSEPITGHIDVLQVKNGLIHILDYKPDAKKINPKNQLLLYALALASRTRLPLRLFVCAWFDEKDYFEFYPLHAVHEQRRFFNNKYEKT